jgi:hypothetical protein
VSRIRFGTAWLVSVGCDGAVDVRSEKTTVAHPIEGGGRGRWDRTARGHSPAYIASCIGRDAREGQSDDGWNLRFGRWSAGDYPAPSARTGPPPRWQVRPPAESGGGDAGGALIGGRERAELPRAGILPKSRAARRVPESSPSPSPPSSSATRQFTPTSSPRHCAGLCSLQMPWYL